MIDSSTSRVVRSISGGTVELSPGYYDGGISVTGNANVTFAPGIYLIGGSGLKITAGTIVGNNVCLMILSGEMKVAGASSVSMSPPASGGVVVSCWVLTRP